MLDFKIYDGPYGIPVYHQHMPQSKAASLGWVMMVGAADDTLIGKPGLYHWFEHVPFRGTAKFPSGTPELFGPLAKLNGGLNAWTNRDKTHYYGSVHHSQWKQTLVRVTDMIAAPLLRPVDIEAERKIIHQEISQARGSVSRSARRELLPHLFPEHPYASDVLGSEESLAQMDTATLIRARMKGYDRSRAVFVSAGPMEIDDLMKELVVAAAELPNHGLSERRLPAYYGQPINWKPGNVQIESEFGTSVIKVLFPMEPNVGELLKMQRATDTCILLDTLFEYGGMSSPLTRIVREERQLVYGIETSYDVYPGGSYFGFTAMAKQQNASAIVDAIRDVILSPELLSPSRLEDMKVYIAASLEMMSLDPDDFREKAIGTLSRYGNAPNYEEGISRFNQNTLGDVDRALKIFDWSKALVFVYKGMGEK